MLPTTSQQDSPAEYNQKRTKQKLMKMPQARTYLVPKKPKLVRRARPIKTQLTFTGDIIRAH